MLVARQVHPVDSRICQTVLDPQQILYAALMYSKSSTGSWTVAYQIIRLLFDGGVQDASYPQNSLAPRALLNNR